VAGSIRRRQDRGSDVWSFELSSAAMRRGGSGTEASHSGDPSARPSASSPGSSLSRRKSRPSCPRKQGLGIDRTLNDALTAWQMNGWEDLSPYTTRRYLSIWNVHIRDDIGRRRIASLSSYDLERWFRDLKRKGLGESSVHQARAMLNRGLPPRAQVSGGVLPIRFSNRSSDLEPARADPGRSCPAVEEVQRLLAEAARYDQRFAALFRLVAATGARVRGLRPQMVRHRR